MKNLVLYAALMCSFVATGLSCSAPTTFTPSELKKLNLNRYASLTSDQKAIVLTAAYEQNHAATDHFLNRNEKEIALLAQARAALYASRVAGKKPEKRGRLVCAGEDSSDDEDEQGPRHDGHQHKRNHLTVLAQIATAGTLAERLAAAGVSSAAFDIVSGNAGSYVSSSSSSSESEEEEKEEEKILCNHQGCDFTTNKHDYLNKHQTQYHNPANTFVCDKCTYSFETKKKLTGHQSLRHPEDPYCQICKRRFSDTYAFGIHNKTYHSGNGQRDGSFKCHICPNSSFASRQNLKQHLASHEEPVPCKICKKLIKPNSVRNHMIQHTNTTEIKCDYCHYKTKNPALLIKHTKTHEAEKIQCPGCDKELSPGGLYRHLTDLHPGELFYKCTVCNEKFMSQGFLNKHLSQNHNIAPVKKKTKRSVKKIH